jgi:hypothetical protein
MMYLRGASLSVESLLGVVKSGDQHCLSDGLIGPGMDVYEYDEFPYHDDVQRDLRKINNLVTVGTDSITRLRRGCSSLKDKLPDMNGCKYF